MLFKISACQSGFKGLNCSVPCESSFCKHNICDRYNGNCLGCTTGRFGNLCLQSCDTCRHGTTCQQIDGKCDVGCVDGNYGSYCQQSCDSCITCEQGSGLCTECPIGKYGALCNLDCSSNCRPVDGTIVCDLQSGACQSRQCAPGYWGTDCFRSCNNNCKNSSVNTVATCNISTGACDYNCTAKFYGLQCDIRCNSFCYDETCDREDGVCVECYKEEPNFNCPNAGKFYLKKCIISLLYHTSYMVMLIRLAFCMTGASLE